MTLRTLLTASESIGTASQYPLVHAGILMGYLSQLPGSMREELLPSGEKAQDCVYSPPSLRATTAARLFDAGERIESVQDLLDHKHIATTQIYDKRRRSVRDSASQTKCRFEVIER